MKLAKVTAKDIIKSHPRIEKTLKQLQRAFSETYDLAQIRALYIGFLVKSIKEDLKNDEPYLIKVMAEVLHVDKRSCYRWLDYATKAAPCECLRGMTTGEIVNNFEKDCYGFGKKILAECAEKLPGFSIRGMNSAALPDGEKKKKIPELPPQTVKANEIMNRQLAFQNQTGLFGLWFEESESINFLYEEAPLDDLKRAKKVADEASENLGKILQEREK